MASGLYRVKVLVTGGAGFIGANFVHYWAKQYPDDHIVVLDALTYAGNQANLETMSESPAYSFVHGDIGDPELVKRLLADEQTDTIVHFAAESHVDRSIHEPDKFIQTNVIGTHNLLKAARAAWLDSDAAPVAHRFHHVSTDEVYGTLGAADPAFSEATPYAPNSPYAASKAASDHLVRSYHHTYGLEVTTSNCSNNYGPYQFPEKLIPLMIVNALTGKSLPVYGDGSNIRDWLYVEDHCRGIDLVINKGKIGETYNIGADNQVSNLELTKRILSALNLPESRIELVTDRPGHDFRYAVDSSKIRKLGWSPQVSLDDGLIETMQWYRDHEDWWRPLKAAIS